MRLEIFQFQPMILQLFTNSFQVLIIGFDLPHIGKSMQVRETKKIVEEGKVKYIGLSEAFASTIPQAHVVHQITTLKIEWSLWSHDVEQEIIPTCRCAFSLLFLIFHTILSTNLSNRVWRRPPNWVIFLETFQICTLSCQFIGFF